MVAFASITLTIAASMRRREAPASVQPVSTEVPLRSSFSVYSEPIDLRFGEVALTGLTWEGNARPIPHEVVSRYADGSRLMAISGTEFDVVRLDDSTGREESVPLSHAYLHHAKIFINNGLEMNSSVLPGGYTQGGQGIGGDFRGTVIRHPAPFRSLVLRPQVWSAVLHLINTRDPFAPLATSGQGAGFSSGFSRLTQCPCTPQRVLHPRGYDNGSGVFFGTVDGVIAQQPACPAALLAERNPTCSFSTYRGGTRCCAGGVSVLDTSRCVQPDCSEYPRERFHVKATFQYEDATPATRSVLELNALDVTFNTRTATANEEYDVPQFRWA